MTRLLIDHGEIARFVPAIFCHASEGQRVQIRAYYEGSEKTFSTDSAVINGAGLAPVIQKAVKAAQAAADAPERVVFCPPLAGFLPKEGREAWRAAERDLKEGYALSVECDDHPKRARNKLEAVLGRPTVVVESGGRWPNPETGELEPKVHLHWRLARPATGEELGLLKEARALATRYVGGDATNITIVHPIRWPGS